MNVLIVGGAGFIGSHLSYYHLEKKDTVIVVDNLITGSEKNIEKLRTNPSFTFIKADVSLPDILKELMPKSIDLIYHLASPASPKQYAHYPLETLMASSMGLHHMLELAHQKKAKLVYASTSEVYGDPLVHPQKEEYWGNVNSFGPRACYDEAKRFGEALCYTYLHTYDTDVRIVRIFNTYGPHMEREDGRVVSNFIVQALSNTDITIYGDGQQTRSFCYVSDLVNGLYLMATKEVRGEVINLGNPIERTIAEFADLIKKLTGAESRIVHKELPADDPKKRKPDITKAQKMLGWEPQVSFEDGLQKTITYFKERFSL